MIFNTILLQADPGGASGLMNILMIVALIAIFYLFMIRPQQKKQKEIRKFREGIKPGDNVVTAGGIYGKIRNIKENTFAVEISKGIVITVDKGSVYPSAQEALKDAENEQKSVSNNQ